MLYGACCRIAKAMGYKKIITYILQSETGTSLKASQFRYMEDWNLGDIVTGKQTAWGVAMDQRITEIEEVYENDAMTVTPTMGNPAPETFNLEDNIG